MKEEKNNIIKLLLDKIREEDDESAFKDLFYLLYHRLVNFSVQYVEHKETAEEIVSDIFTKLWIDRSNTKHIVNPETYLFIAVKNRSLNYVKKFSRFRIIHLEETNEDKLVNNHDPEKELERRELNFKMDAAIETLPQQCKIVFNLVKQDGLKYKEVAEILEISPRTVETQLVRALKKLNQIIGPYESTGTNRQTKSGSKNIRKIFSLLFSFPL